MRRGYATHCDGCDVQAVDRKESPDSPYTTPGLTDWLLVQQLDGGYEVRRSWAFCSWPCMARVALVDATPDAVASSGTLSEAGGRPA